MAQRSEHPAVSDSLCLASGLAPATLFPSDRDLRAGRTTSWPVVSTAPAACSCSQLHPLNSNRRAVTPRAPLLPAFRGEDKSLTGLALIKPSMKPA